MKIAKGDSVVVITGKDKGKTGTVLSVLKNKNKVVVAGINMRTKHVKKTPQRAGEKITYEGSIAVSNVMLVDPKTSKRTRVGYKVTEKGKVRVAKRSGETIGRKDAKESKDAKDAKETRASTKKKSVTGKAKTSSDSSASSAPYASSKRQPFWKRKKDASEGSEDGEVSGGRDDHGASDQSTSRRSASRGS